MATNILLITHPGIGEALKRTATTLLGRLPTRVETLAIPWQLDVHEALSAARARCAELNGGGVLVMTDLFGATPANIGRRLARPKQVAVICGLNLPMLLKALNYCGLQLDEVVEKALNGGREGIVRNTPETC